MTPGQQETGKRGPFWPGLGEGFVAARKWLYGLMVDGIDLTENAHVKLVNEAEELRDDLTIDEAADVFIALVGVCLREGWTGFDLARAIVAKVDVNRAREWVQVTDGTYQHKESVVSR